MFELFRQSTIMYVKSAIHCRWQSLCWG